MKNESTDTISTSGVRTNDHYPMAIKHYTIPVFIPELACPYQCVFCDQRKITGKKQVPHDDAILQSIEDHLRSFKDQNSIVEIGFFGGSFTRDG